MAATTLTITATLEAPGGGAASGYVEFTPNFTGAHFANNGVSVPNAPQSETLTAGGNLPASFAVIRCSGGYSVTEYVSGAEPYGPYQIPDQVGPVDLSSYR